MIDVAVCDINTGEILRAGRCQLEYLNLQALTSDEEAIEINSPVDDMQEYYNGTVFILRPSFTLQYTTLTIDTTETLNISNIPTGTTVTHPDGSTVVDDGYIDWSCVEPGEYEFSFDNFPYKPVSLNATVITA